MNCEVCGIILQASRFRICSMPCYGAMWACAGGKIPFYEPPQLEPDLEWELKQDLEWEQMWKLGWGPGRLTKYKKYGPEFDLDLKERIRKREGSKCFLCESAKRTSRSLQVHHIDYNKFNNNESNLVALCMNCHPTTNGSRDYWQEHIIDLMEIVYGYNYENN